MGALTGLDQIKRFKDEQARRKAEAEAGRLTWLSIKDGETVQIRFLQELDKNATGYLESHGLGVLAVEHANPDRYQQKAICTMDTEGKCWMCEQSKAAYRAGDKKKGAAWGQKQKLYINVLVERKDKETGELTRSVAVYGISAGSRSVIAEMIFSMAIDENTITDRWWKISRRGAELSDTTYTSIPQAPKDDVDLADYEVFDLKRCYREIPYDEQEAFFNGVADRRPVEDTDADKAPDHDEEW
jgi:hypothetical protein